MRSRRQSRASRTCVLGEARVADIDAPFVEHNIADASVDCGVKEAELDLGWSCDGERDDEDVLAGESGCEVGSGGEVDAFDGVDAGG